MPLLRRSISRSVSCIVLFKTSTNNQMRGCDYDVLLQSTMVVLRSIVRSESAVKNREFVARNAIDPLLSDIVFKNGSYSCSQE